MDADISKYFDNVSHNILLAKVKKVFPNEPELYHLIYRFIKTGWVERPPNNEKLSGKIREPIHTNEQGAVIKGRYHKRLKGIPQGGILSGLLSNLYLNDFDHEILTKFPQVKYVRYADDFLIFCRSFEEYWSVYRFARGFLEGQLVLELNSKKTKYRKVHEPRLKKTEPFVDFLGYRVCPNKIKIQPKNMQAFKDKMKEIIERWGKSDKMVGTLIKRINRKIDGRLYEFNAETGSSILGRNWTAYFSLLTGHGQLKELDDWLAAALLRAIRKRNIKNHTRRTLRNRKLHTLVRLHYKMKHHKAQQFEDKARQLKLSLVMTQATVSLTAPAEA